MIQFMTDDELKKFKEYIEGLDPETLFKLIQNSGNYQVPHLKYGAFRYDLQDAALYFVSTKMAYENETTYKFAYHQGGERWLRPLLLKEWDSFVSIYTQRRVLHE